MVRKGALVSGTAEEIDGFLTQVPKFENERIETIKERMKKSLEEMTDVNYDEGRLEQELLQF